MADNDQHNDEYQYADPDELHPDSLEGDSTPAVDDHPGRRPLTDGGARIKRNALIAVGLVVLSMLGYKFLHSFFAVSPHNDEIASVPSITAETPVKPPPSVPSEAGVQTPSLPVIQQAQGEDSAQLSEKLSSLEAGQQSVRSEVNTVNNQLDGISTNVNDLTGKIADLNHMLAVLAARIDRQSSEISQLTQKTKPKPVRRHVAVRRPAGRLYYIQAVIPGRAWLIARNGSTLTVREGTPIAGYGVVKLIDPNQGRVVTSSGRVIRFSQQDS